MHLVSFSWPSDVSLGVGWCTTSVPTVAGAEQVLFVWMRWLLYLIIVTQIGKKGCTTGCLVFTAITYYPAFVCAL